MADHCSFCGFTTGPFSNVEGPFTVLMCADCQAARGYGSGPYPMMTRAEMRAGLDLMATWALEQNATAFSAPSIALIKARACLYDHPRGCSMADSRARSASLRRGDDQRRVDDLGGAWSSPVGDGQVSSRDERVARNESTTREINEDIEQAQQAASTPDHVRIVCECGRLECDRVLAITLAEYESVRADPRQFAVTRDHVMAEVERVVAETDRYAVVAKRQGTPAAVAIEEDPRG
jgi:hypothetical protein